MPGVTIIPFSELGHPDKALEEFLERPVNLGEVTIDDIAFLGRYTQRRVKAGGLDSRLDKLALYAQHGIELLKSDFFLSAALTLNYSLAVVFRRQFELGKHNVDDGAIKFGVNLSEATEPDNSYLDYADLSFFYLMKTAELETNHDQKVAGFRYMDASAVINAKFRFTNDPEDALKSYRASVNASNCFTSKELRAKAHGYATKSAIDLCLLEEGKAKQEEWGKTAYDHAKKELKIQKSMKSPAITFVYRVLGRVSEKMYEITDNRDWGNRAVYWFTLFLQQDKYKTEGGIYAAEQTIQRLRDKLG